MRYDARSACGNYKNMFPETSFWFSSVPIIHDQSYMTITMFILWIICAAFLIFESRDSFPRGPKNGLDSNRVFTVEQNSDSILDGDDKITNSQHHQMTESTMTDLNSISIESQSSIETTYSKCSPEISTNDFFNEGVQDVNILFKGDQNVYLSQYHDKKKHNAPQANPSMQPDAAASPQIPPISSENPCKNHPNRTVHLTCKGPAIERSVENPDRVFSCVPGKSSQFPSTSRKILCIVENLVDSWLLVKREGI